MGCASSAPLPPRPAPLPVDFSAAKLVLTRRGSANELRFAQSEQLRVGVPSTPLSLSSHPGLTIVASAAESGPHAIGCDKWMVVELGVGSDNGTHGIRVHMDAQGFITSSHAPNSEEKGATPSMVFDIAWWKYEDGNKVNLVGEASRNSRSRDGGGGRSFILLPEGSIAVAKAPHLVLGIELPDCTLVSKGSANKVIIAAADALRAGQPTALHLSSHPGYAIVPKFDEPRRIDEWRVSYQHWGIGPAANAATVRLDGQLIVSQVGRSADYVLDVPFDKRTEGCGDLPLAVIAFDDHHKTFDRSSSARLFVVNGDGSISPARSPELALGLRTGANLLPLTGVAGGGAQPIGLPQVVPVVMATPVVVNATPVGLPVGAGSSYGYADNYAACGPKM